jgi:hypothetical protein
MDKSDQQQCEVCDRLKEPVEIQIHSTETSDSETTLDRLRGFVTGTSSGSEADTSETTSTDNDEETLTSVFYICPHLPCEGRENDVSEMERWELKNDPNREFSEEKLDEIVAERIAQEKNDHRIITETADEVYNRLVRDAEETGDNKNTDET